MAQELTSGLGRPLTWRDKIRNYMRERYGEQGAQLAEGLIGVSEEEQQMRSLQRRYGSELPEDAALDRPMRERFTDPSDLGGIDKLLMALSGTASVAPRLATTASATESAALFGDAMGSYKKGDKVGAGLQTGLALLPMGLGMLGRDLASGGGTGLDDLLPKPQTEVSMAGTPYTMSITDEPLYFSKQTGKMGGGGGKVTDMGTYRFQKRLPDELLTGSRTPTAGYGDILFDLNVFAGNQLSSSPIGRSYIKDIEMGDYIKPDWSVDPKLKTASDDPNVLVPAEDDQLFINGLDDLLAFETIGKTHFGKYGLTPKDINTTYYEEVAETFGSSNRSFIPEGAEKSTAQYEEFVEEISRRIDSGEGVTRTTLEGASPAQKYGKDPIIVFTLEVDNVPVGVYRNLDYEDAVVMFPNNKGLAKLDNPAMQGEAAAKADNITGRTRLDEIETEEANLLKTQRLMETANKDVGSQTLNDPNFESLTPSEQRNLLRTQNLMRNEKEIRSLEDQLYMKNAIRNQEGHLMSTNNLTKLTNEIDALEARINALKGK
jgi:hypothetical protein